MYADTPDKPHVDEAAAARVCRRREAVSMARPGMPRVVDAYGAGAAEGAADLTAGCHGLRDSTSE